MEDTAPRQTRCFAAAVALAFAVALLWPAIPPLIDLPTQMARYRVGLDLGSSPYLSLYYDYRWALFGNLRVDLLVVPLARLFGLELAIKLIGLTIPALTASAMVLFSRGAWQGAAEQPVCASARLCLPVPVRLHPDACRSYSLAEALERLPRRAFDFVLLINVHPDQWPRDPKLKPVWRNNLFGIGISLGAPAILTVLLGLPSALGVIATALIVPLSNFIGHNFVSFRKSA